MNDEKIRELLHEAHAGDRPPPFVMPEPRRRWWRPLLLAGVVAAAIVAGFYLPIMDRRPPPVRVDVALPAIHYPTDVLLPASGLEVPEPTKGLLQ
jgi:hypothetical protein